MLIVFEGIDGSGTTTQANYLRNTLRDKGFTVISKHFPDVDNQLGYQARMYLQGVLSGGAYTSKIINHLCLAERAQWAYEYELQDLKIITILERYTWSSIAYGSYNINEFIELAHLNKDFPKPNITFYLEVDPEVASQRIKSRGAPEEYYENLTESKRVIENYWNILRDPNTFPKGIFHVLDGSKSIDEIKSQVLKLTEDLLGVKYGK